MSNVQDNYRRLRAENPEIGSAHLLQWARDRVKIDAVTTEIEWSDGPWSRDLLIVGTLPDGVEIRVYPDDEVYDWGDCEPTEQEREDLEVIGVGVRVPGDDDDLDAIWSVSYLDSNMTGAAIRAAVEYGFIDSARREIAERERTRGYVETVR